MASGFQGFEVAGCGLSGLGHVKVSGMWGSGWYMKKCIPTVAPKCIIPSLMSEFDLLFNFLIPC